MVKFTTVKISAISINQVAPHIRKYVSGVEIFSNSTENFYARIKFNDEAEYGYIYKSDGKVLAVHYCESVKTGASCKHRAILAAIAEQFDLTIDAVNVKASIKDYHTFTAAFANVPWVNKDDQFLITAASSEESASFVDESEEEAVPATSSVTVSAVTQSRDWKSEWPEIEAYLDSQKIDLPMQTLILELRKSISTNVPLSPNMIAPKKLNMPYQGVMFEEAISHILLGEHLLLIGDAGTGKDTLINTISWVLNYPVLLQVGSKDETKESLVAEPAFINNESTHALSLISKTVRDGGLINFAEINFLQGSTTSVLHPLFDDNGVLPTPLGGIEGNRHLLLCASMNVGEGYAGINTLNKAFKDRFCVLRLRKTMGFKESISKKTGLTDTAALEFLEAINNGLKELFVENIATAADTVRGYIKAATYLYSYGFTHKTRVRVVEAYVINRIEEADEYCQAREAVRDVFHDLKLQAFPVTDDELLFNPNAGH